jgi:hypothetical protein|tara:strand:- start:28 stop:702 length:675 start_codon:yes stop_codon:yes gene_type:complete
MIQHAEFEVRKIESKDTDDWILNKHYAKRKCQRMHCYGLFINDEMEGIVTYGMPPSPQVGRGFLGEENRTNVLELNRLCINESAPRNSASALVGRSLKSLPPCAVVSYADGAMGHIGYVYQATNFIYCGSAKSHDKEYLIDGKWTHAKVLTNRGISSPSKWAKEKGIETKSPQAKHRYIYFVDKSLKKFLKYPKYAYPKGDTKRYESQDIHKKSLQGDLFLTAS